MNHRREPRFPVDRMVDVTVLETPNTHVRCRIVNASGRGIGLQLKEKLAIGTPLKITLEDAILLGEVIYCQARETEWYAGVELEHALCGLAELADALRGFTEGDSGSEGKDSMYHARRQHEQ
jgi:hypothetical protein